MAKNDQVFVRFESGAYNRESPAYGPFDYVQLVYGSLTVGWDGGGQGEILAEFTREGLWYAPDDEDYTDVIIAHCRDSVIADVVPMVFPAILTRRAG